MNSLVQLSSNLKNTFMACALSCLCTAALQSAEAADQVQKVYYVAAASPADNRSVYYISLLQMALQKSGKRYDLRANHTSMPLKRAMQNGATSGSIDVFWGPTTQEKEDNYLPVRIPIDKGILGWRLLIVRARDRQLFEGVHTLGQLQLYTAGLQRDWSDMTVFRENGLTVVGADAYETMFAMLAEDRFQYFPRGIVEIENELKSHAYLKLELDQYLALHYPVFSYYFVRKGNQALANAIERGLHALIADGSFDRTFEKFNGEAIRRAHLGSRTVIEMKNPLLPDHLPATRPEDRLH